MILTAETRESLREKLYEEFCEKSMESDYLAVDVGVYFFEQFLWSLKNNKTEYAGHLINTNKDYNDLFDIIKISAFREALKDFSPRLFREYYAEKESAYNQK